MSAATAELVRLIDLSLGSQPSGVVNFNYLHTLMHAIVSRLGSMELAYLATAGEGAAVGPISLGPGGDIAVWGTAGAREGEVSGAGGAGGVTATTVGSKEGLVPSGPSEGVGGSSQETPAEEGVDDGTKKESSVAAADTGPPPPPPATTDLSESRTPTSGRASRAGLQSSVAEMYHRQRPSFVTAANDLGAMERKLQELESRLNTMDTLPELLERKSSDMGATPIKDRWNFTNLTKRLSAAEDGLEQVCCMCVCVCVCVCVNCDWKCV